MSNPMPLTVDQFRQALPDKVKKTVNQQLIDKINVTLSDPELYETYRDNLLGYSKIMAEGKFRITNYIDAVKYVGFKLMGIRSSLFTIALISLRLATTRAPSAKPRLSLRG